MRLRDLSYLLVHLQLKSLVYLQGLLLLQLFVALHLKAALGMNEFYEKTGFPTDLVYTAKLFFGLMQIIKQGGIARGSKICVVHSGGLQGNRSLSEGTLVY